MRKIVFDVLFEDGCVLVVLCRYVSVGLYLIANVVIERCFFIISIAFIDHIAIGRCGADHIIHPTLIHKLIIISKAKPTSYRLAIAQREFELHHPVAELSMADDEYQCFMFGLEYIAVEYQITPDGIKEYKYE